METLCSFGDSFNAIYKCICKKLLCSKHYFSHQEDFADHQIYRIRIDVNNQSRQVLINFIISYKQNLISILNNADLNLLAENSEKYQHTLAFCNSWIHHLHLLLLFLKKAKYIEKKEFYTPFEYFLHQPVEKALKYVSDFKFPEVIENIKHMSCEINIFHFNYFKFENKNYIFDFMYIQSYDTNNILYVCFSTLKNFLSSSEYEMGYEALQNFINFYEITDIEAARFWGEFAKIIYNFIKKKTVLNY